MQGGVLWQVLLHTLLLLMLLLLLSGGSRGRRLLPRPAGLLALLGPGVLVLLRPGPDGALSPALVRVVRVPQLLLLAGYGGRDVGVEVVD